VTNAQFEAFVNAHDGFCNAKWFEPEWIEAGWVKVGASPSPRWTEPNAPRETVSWHEAVAFCRWLDYRLRALGKLTSKQQIRLPTEWEWQQAATGGDPNRGYPWLGEWYSIEFNGRHTKIERTSAVGLYPSAAALCTAVDMAGNCFEWCCNKDDPAHDCSLSGLDIRVFRGGSWTSEVLQYSADSRSGHYPNARANGYGFRLCMSSPIEGY
jgi:formylglycine-generating enzyme required for sulfatase activity